MSGQRCLPVAAILPSPLNARHEGDEGGLCDLAASMQAQGLLQPVVVWQEGPETWRLIFGGRRLRAARLLAWEHIPALIRQEPTESEARTLTLVENLQRSDLNPIEEAEAMRALYLGGMPQGEIARQIGRTGGFVSNRIRLLRLPEGVQGALRDGRLSVEWGETLLHWSEEPERCDALARSGGEGGLTLAGLQKRAREEGRVRLRTVKGESGKKGGSATDRQAEKERLLQAMFGPLTLPASRDCRRLALVAYEHLIQLAPASLSDLLGARGLDHLAPLIDLGPAVSLEEGLEALAALSCETLICLGADAILARDVEQFEGFGAAPRRARWYAGLEGNDV